jgi:hypothetical protein
VKKHAQWKERMDSDCYINWDRVVPSMQELRSFTGAARDEMVEGLSLPGLGTEHATPKPLPSSLPVSQATTQPRCVSDGPVMRRLAAQLSVIGDRTARWRQLMPGAAPVAPSYQTLYSLPARVNPVPIVNKLILQPQRRRCAAIPASMSSCWTSVHLSSGFVTVGVV